MLNKLKLLSWDTKNSEDNFDHLMMYGRVHPLPMQVYSLHIFIPKSTVHLSRYQFICEFIFQLSTRLGYLFKMTALDAVYQFFLEMCSKYMFNFSVDLTCDVETSVVIADTFLTSK